MKLKVLSGSQRREVARERWHKHVVAQRASGQTQVAYLPSAGRGRDLFLDVETQGL